MSEKILLHLKNVSVHYGNVHALDGVDIVLNEGEIVALMGPNGAGKSTILKAIFGLTLIQTGQILWHEKTIIPVPHRIVHSGVAFVPQGRRVFGNLTVKENLEIGAFTVEDKIIVKQRIEKMLELFPDLNDKLTLKSSSLSGGQQQMLTFARGLMTDPKILLLDEPSLGLSPKIVKEVFAKIKEVNKRRKTAIIVAEHNMKSLLKIADRGYVLNKGKIVAKGDSQKLLKDEIIKKVFLGKFKK